MSERRDAPWFVDSPEFVPEWDVHRYDDGTPVTLTPEQGRAVIRAMEVLAMVEEAEGGSCEGFYLKSRLLGRMLYEGLPPTRTKPPYDMGAPWWPLLPGGDPFLTDAEKAQRAAEVALMNKELVEMFKRGHLLANDVDNDGTRT